MPTRSKYPSHPQGELVRVILDDGTCALYEVPLAHAVNRANALKHGYERARKVGPAWFAVKEGRLSLNPLDGSTAQMCEHMQLVE